MLLELDHEVEMALTLKAQERGIAPDKLAAELVQSALSLNADATSLESVARRKALVQEMLRESKGRTLGLKEMGVTMSQFIHEEHPY